MDCAQCGKPLAEGAQYCNYCGKKLGEEAPSEILPYQQGYYPPIQPVKVKSWSKGQILLLVLAVVLGLVMLAALYGFYLFYRVDRVMDSVDYWRKADNSYHAGDYEEAVEYCDRAIDSEPEFAKPYELRGMSLCELGRYDEARTDLEKALDLDPDLDDAKKYLRKLDAAGY